MLWLIRIIWGFGEGGEEVGWIRSEATIHHVAAPTSAVKTIILGYETDGGLLREPTLRLMQLTGFGVGWAIYCPPRLEILVCAGFVGLLGGWWASELPTLHLHLIK